MSIVLRIWREAKAKAKEAKAIQANWTIWDRGDEMWELKGDVLRHFEVLDRTRGSDNVITEHLRLLHESAIPLEAIRQSVQGWEIEERVAQTLPQARPVLPLTSSPLSTPTPSPRTNDPRAAGQLAARIGQSDGSSKKGSSPSKNLLSVESKHSDQPEANESEKNTQSTVSERQSLSGEKSHLVTPLQSAQEIQVEESSQPFYNHPTELWSSLSQWIPPHALFQPSLHHQATLELSDTPAQTYPYQIDSSKNSRPAQGQRQHVRQGQQTKPYRPKPSLREIEIPKRPLFV